MGAWLMSPTPAMADNACSFACTATFIAPGQQGSLTSCTTDQQCQDFCARTCGSLNPVGYVDRAHPSTCGTGTPRQCSPCTCTPNARIACTGTAPTAACTRGCTDTCSAYNSSRPAGVANIACATTPAATCAVPQVNPPAAQGFCHFGCTFGPTQPVRTSVTCTPSSPSECSTSNTALRTACTSIGMEPATSMACVAGDDGPKCVVQCIRPTAVSESDRGSCPARPESRADTDICLNRCQTVCGNRGMVCANDRAECNSGGRCEFACAVSTTATQHDDRATVCTATGGAATCANRCAAFCRERGGTCVSSPAAACQMPDSASGGTTDPSSSGQSGSTGSSGSSGQSGSARTAPRLRVTFPDPFGGRLTAQEVIGNIIRILVGLCGVFFLGVFVYGGLLYLTSAGDPKAVQKGQGALVNAVIGLVVVLVAYIAVAFVVQVSDQLQTGDIGAVDQSQNALDDDPNALRPGGTTQATGRSSQGGTTGSADPFSTVQPQAGTPAAACRSYYRADPATCSSGSGPCPAGASDLASLISVWSSRFPAPSPELRDPAASCRTCLEGTIQSMRGQYPGIDTTCMPALVNLWSTTCRSTCNVRAVTSGDAPGLPASGFSREAFCAQLLERPDARPGSCDACVTACQQRTICSPGSPTYIGARITTQSELDRQTFNCRDTQCSVCPR